MLDLDMLSWDREQNEAARIEEVSLKDIAIIGISAQLPEAEDAERFWEKLREGKDCIAPFPASRRQDAEAYLRRAGLSEEKVSYYDGAFLGEIDKFDHAFFRLSPKEASLMTPNQRLFLEQAWRAIEDAGYGGGLLDGSRTGVYVGFNNDTMHDYKSLIADVDPELLSLAVPGNLSSVIAGRISYLLNLRGPAVCIDTACSSSLVALHAACQALRGGECDMAIAGSVKIALLPFAHEVKIGIEASDWRARTFDDRADGTGAGEGVVAMMLKPLARALEDGDAVYAVIKGSAVNQDGSSVGLTAPNVRAQEDVIVRAWEDANVDPLTISYIEAHGTGTKLGDPIEVEGINRAFGRYTDRRQFVAVGSLKTNIGHLDHAAGIAGVLKAVLAMRHRQIPASLHFVTPNKQIDFADSPVYVNAELADWETNGQPRRCGVSAFGMSGTNCHVVLEEAPDREDRREGLTRTESSAERETREGVRFVFPLSAKSEAALDGLIRAYLEPSARLEGVSIADAAHTAQTGRWHYRFRVAIVCDSIETLLTKLRRLTQTGLRTDKSAGLYYGASETRESEIRQAEGLLPDELAAQYADGMRIDWKRLNADVKRNRVHLPAYAFERTRCWLDLAPSASTGVLALADGQEDRYTQTERVIAAVWAETLGIETLDVQESYFALGGDSILAIKIVNRLRQEHGMTMLEAAHLMQYDTVADLAKYVEIRGGGKPIRAADGRQTGIAARQIDGTSTDARAVVTIPEQAKRLYYPLTPSQRRVFVQEQRGASGTGYNMPLAFAITGELEPERLLQAASLLVRRHEAFRTRFDWHDGEPVQIVQEAAEADLLKAQAGSAEEADGIARGWIRPFDIGRAPLLRVGLIQLPEGEQLLFLDLHHLIGDGASIGIVMNDLLRLYQGNELESNPLPVRYTDFAVWYQGWMASEEAKRRADYWRESLEAPLPLLRLPLDRNRHVVTRAYAGDTIPFAVSAELTQALAGLAGGQQLTLNSLLFGLFSLLVSQYAGQTEAMIGTVAAGRPLPELEGLVGMFIHYLPVRVRTGDRETLADYLQATNRSLREALAHEYPYDAMIRQLAGKTDPTRNPFYDAMFIYHNESGLNALQTGSLEAAGLRVADYPLPQEVSPLDVKLDAYPQPDGSIKFAFNYSTELFDRGTMERFGRLWMTLLWRLAEERDALLAFPLSELALWSSEEEEALRAKRDNNDVPTAGIAPALEPESKPLRLLIGATFTADGIGRHIEEWTERFGIDLHAEYAPYNQVFQQLLDGGSELAANDGVNVIFVRFEDWLGEARTSAAAGIRKLQSLYDELIEAIGRAPKRVPIGVAVFPVTPHLGIPGELAVAIRETQARLLLEVEGMERVFAVDCTRAADDYGIAEPFDAVKEAAAHMPFSEAFEAAIGATVARRIVAWRRPPFKVLALDCDNTIWKGVCGEDGALGVAITEPFQAVQRQALALHDAGVLIALCSKNNEADVWEVFDRHPDMLLRREHIVHAAVNWRPKPDNIRALAKQLNLGLDSFIFLDDSPVECAAMISELPEVLTLRLPDDPARIPSYLRHVWAFDRWKTSEEDRMRTRLYRSESQRQEAKEQASSVDDFLRSLSLEMSVSPIVPAQLGRIAQLTQRTNQFNLNPVRRTEAELARWLSEPKVAGWAIEARDRFGDYGLVGALVAESRDETLRIQAFMLSCRVLGRRAEDAAIASVAQYAADKGLRRLEAWFARSAKNDPMLAYLERGGWTRGREEGGMTVFAYAIDDVPAAPAFIALSEASLSVSGGLARSERPSQGRGDHSADSTSAADSAASAALLELAATQVDPRVFGEPGPWHAEPIDSAGLLHAAYYGPLRHHTERSLLELAAARPSASSAGVRGEDAPTADYASPIGETEGTLAELCRELLGRPFVGATDDFFALGASSLDAAAYMSRIYKRLGVQVSFKELFEFPTVRELARRLDGRAEEAGTESAVEPTPAVVMDLYPVNSAQKRLMMITQQPGGEKALYNVPGAVKLTGPLDWLRLDEALRGLVARHEALRTVFEWKDGAPVQRVRPEAQLDIELYEAEDEEAIADIAREFVRSFDLGQAPLARSGVVRLGSGGTRHLLLFDLHHLIADGASMQVIIEDFAALYAGVRLPELALHAKEFAAREQTSLTAARKRDLERYWSETVYAEEPPALQLPTDYPRPALQRYEGARHYEMWDADLVALARGLAAETGATLFMVLLAAFNVLLAKYAGQEDIVVGTPAAGRTHPGAERVVGMFAGTLALRNRPRGDLSFKAFVAAVKAHTIEAFEHQDYPFEELVRQLDLPPDSSRHPLFSVMFVLQRRQRASLLEGNLFAEPHDLPQRLSRFDLTLDAAEREEGLLLGWEYAASLFRPETVKRMAGHFAHIIRQAAADPGLPIARLELLTEAESRQLRSFQPAEPDYDRTLTLSRAFERQAALTPDRIAVVSGGREVRYAELNACANELAARLGAMDVQVGSSRVAILMDRSWQMVATVLAVLKAGAAYVAIDPEYPQDRVRYMLEDSEAILLVAEERYWARFGWSGKRLSAEDFFGEGDPGSRPDPGNPEAVGSPQDLAYIIYTSGSTGAPKGVMVPHLGMLNLEQFFKHDLGIRPEDRIVQFASASFDASVWETFMALLTGASLSIAAKETIASFSRFERFLNEQGITVATLPPTYAIGLTPSRLPSLRLIVTAGSAASPEQVRKWTPHAAYVNAYGPTETTICATWWQADARVVQQEGKVSGAESGISAEASGEASVPIGRALPNMRAYIVNASGQLQPIGVPGELWIGGDGIARGYHGKPELTAEKFIASPFRAGERVYKTGDLAKWLPSGHIEYLGRADHQIKLRGFRIELGEIEQALRAYPGVREAAVIVRRSEALGEHLCAYYTAEADAVLKPAEIQSYAAAKLPAYMVPAFAVPLAAMPLTPNGKVDAKSLPEPDAGTEVNEQPHLPPSTETEAVLASMWETLLGVSSPGVDRSFFELGGHSLKAAELLAAIHERFGADLAYRQIFESPTIRELAAVIDRQESRGGPEQITSVPRGDLHPLSAGQRRIYLESQLPGAEYASHMPSALLAEGKLDAERAEAALAAVIGRHETLRTSFVMHEGMPAQRVSAAVDFRLERLESAHDAMDVDDWMSRFVRPFDLTAAPLLRAGIVRLAPERHLLLFDMHHIVSDGLSIGNLVREFALLYEGGELPKLRIQYIDYAAWQEERFAARREKLERYWLEALAGELPVLRLPEDYARRSSRSRDGGSVAFELGRDLGDRLSILAAERGCTVYMVLLAGFAALLTRYSGQEDLVIGTPVSGREHRDAASLIGMFAGTVPLRCRPSGGIAFARFLDDTRTRVLEAFEHGDYPFELLAERLAVRREPGRHPIFDVMFAMQDPDLLASSMSDLTLKPCELARRGARFDVTLDFYKEDGVWKGAFVYAEALYAQGTIEKMKNRYLALLGSVAESPDLPLQDIPLGGNEPDDAGQAWESLDFAF
ncbi:non-ribosomal peptide synthetase [Paenibacillus methanolicus]|uniref:HAD superfamily phosphatase (TIGR01681 family)/FkbH-like protein/amino acid adenylation domain-containing protein n=1 Tax=Paenibacillus methanolicus TaxID=582686 RepID=A0A5S5C4G0_9BACL|nr:non-ribosomal peptide synthetase [Paenibacillus methanolicus]TYP74029.1 HAD superfamily phosphatase (TIGR01681 family)/FkbH-like protein/amino acid adenylation domain-containing protein [Paenibacillus methanolicus]